MTKAIAVTLAALVLAACSPPPAAAPASPPADPAKIAAQEAAQSAIVMDGDTFRLNGKTYRLANVDAPGLPGAARCWAEARLGVAAKDQLRLFIYNARGSLGLHLTESPSQPMPGVVLVTAKGGAVDLGEELIDEGLGAAVTDGASWDWCSAPSDAEAGAALLNPRRAYWDDVEIDADGGSPADSVDRMTLHSPPPESAADR